MAKLIKYLVIHCSGTAYTMQVDGSMIKLWHMSPPPSGNGWSRPGYWKFIRRNGKVDVLHEINEDNFIESHEMTWGAKGVNDSSVHICLAGGHPRLGVKRKEVYDFFELFTDEQFMVLKVEIKEFIAKHPQVKVVGHYQVDYREIPKTCPNVNIPELCEFISIPKNNVLYED